MGEAHLLRLDQLELHPPARPGDEVSVRWVIQQGHQKLPQLQGTPALVGRSLSECSHPFLLDVSWGAQGTGV